MKSEIDFFGLIIGNDVVSADPTKFDVIVSCPKLETLTELQSFLGLIKVFRRLIKDFSGIVAPHTYLTNKYQGIQKWEILNVTSLLNI